MTAAYPHPLQAIRQVQVQAIGAAISRRNWHDCEAAYNQVRDRIDAALAAGVFWFHSWGCASAFGYRGRKSICPENGRGMTGRPAADALRDNAHDVARLSPDWNNPQRFFETRSEIEHQLRRLARDLDKPDA